jgi:peptidyl-prolyl cis-trans isomerase SurA
MKKLITFCLLALLAAPATGQVLFTYGKKTADAADFLRAFNKNNQATGKEREKALQDYLQLYINSRLRIEEAYSRGYDTLPHLRNEVNNLRAQISENYMNDPGVIDRLVREAFLRSQKDIRVSQIFISLRDENGIVQEEAAEKKKNDILKRLKAGESFSSIATAYSDDPAAKFSGGDLGYITVFTLPYEIENLVYSLGKGKYSEPLRSGAGYHIFRKTDERKAVGKMRAQQILLAYPPNADDAQKKRIATLADSLYKRLQVGDEFGKLASAFSNDYVSAANGGTLPDIGVGQYDPAFESVLWSLEKDGTVSKPFQTAHGWHILKRISLMPVNADSNARQPMADLRNRVMQDSRWRTSKDFIYTRVKQKAGFTRYDLDRQALWAFSDSLLDRKPLQAIGRALNGGTPLFRIGDSVYRISAWLDYAGTYRFRPDGSGAKPYEQVLDEFEKWAMLHYYRDHLEDFNPEFRAQMEEFRDGNLFFEIMQVEIWNKAQMDTAALMALYERKKTDYKWDRSVDAILFFSSDVNTAQAAHAEIKKDPAGWRAVVNRYIDKLVADSSRFEWEQIPNLVNLDPQPGMLTEPFAGETDGTSSFAYIIRVNRQPLQRSFAEARGMVINDYQSVLEEQWNQALRRKYPVKINEQTLKAILKPGK